MESIFERLGSLATLLDDELQTIETRFRVLSSAASQSHFDGPAKKVVECQREMESMKKDIDGLIQVADEQYKHFDGFLKGIIDTLAEFDGKIEEVEQHAANYGYVAVNRDKVDLPRLLSNIENEEVKKSKQEAVIVDSPNILHAGISKETLAKLGVKVKAVDKPVVAHQHEQLYSPPKESVEGGDDEDDEDITSPLPSILKKPKPLKLTEESRVEISPGLFTKRPSKSSEKVEKVEEINLDLDQSPKLPSLKTVNLNHLLNEKNGNKKDVEISGDTPEMPDFKTTEVRHWSTQKKSGQRSSLRPSKATNGNEGLNREDDNAPTTPEMPLFQSQAGKLFSAKKALRNNKENTDPDEEEKEDTDDNQQYIKEASSAADVSSLCETPELPECKTINLASLLQKSKGTVL